MSLVATKRTVVRVVATKIAAVVVVVVDVVVCVVEGVVGVVVVTSEVVVPRVAKNMKERRTNRTSEQTRAGVIAFLTSWAKELNHRLQIMIWKT